MGKPNRQTAHREPTIENRRARHDYHVERTLEVGIALRGSEVKSVRSSLVSLAEGYVMAEETPPTLSLHGVHIGEYPPAAGINQHVPTRTRRLLAHKKEIVRLAQETARKGVTIVPLRLYFKNGYAKLQIGVAVGKKAHDRREDIKERDMQREIRRAMSRRV